MKKIGDSLGYTDIVRVKLGMTPDQAFAAIRASNPKLKIEIINTRMDNPTGPQGSITRVPHYTLAHTTHPTVQTTYTLPDASQELIALEFTTPPNPPLVAKIVRYVGFAAGQPVPASTLVDALRQKYGQENFSDGVSRFWIF